MLENDLFLLEADVLFGAFADRVEIIVIICSVLVLVPSEEGFLFFYLST